MQVIVEIHDILVKIRLGPSSTHLLSTYLLVFKVSFAIFVKCIQGKIQEFLKNPPERHSQQQDCQPAVPVQQNKLQTPHKMPVVEPREQSEFHGGNYSPEKYDDTSKSE